MENKKNNIITVILAAGASRRMGSPKQLLRWGDSSLLVHTIKTVLQLEQQDVIVVLGANFDTIKKGILEYPISILNNNLWELGLGKSIACAVEYITKTYKAVDGVMITLADQPLITSSYLEHLCSEFRVSGNSIIATSYKDGKYGVPVVFGKKYFKELILLNDDTGAKYLLKKHHASIDVLKPLSENLDIDSKADYDYLYSRNFKSP